MIIKQFTMGPIEVNTYLIACQATNEAALIDFGGYDLDKIKKFVADNKLTLRMVLLTHGHFDHSMGARQLQDEMDLPVYISEGDKELIMSLEHQLIAYGMPVTKPPERLTFIKDKDIITLGEMKIHVLATPGHTPGGVCYSVPKRKKLFAGDTIFMDAIGRTDLPGASYEQLLKSIQEKILFLPDDTDVYCGHGPDTTVGREKELNPFFGVKSRYTRNI